MRARIIVILALFIITTSNTQEKSIETESVTLDNLITFIVDHSKVKADSTKHQNITFLIETYGDNFITEDKVILKQAFKLLSKRLTEEDKVSIVMHSDFNGIALNQVNGKAIKQMLYVIEHPKSSVKTLEDDGVELAYEFMNDHFIEAAQNTVVMIRTPNRKNKASEETMVKNTVKNKGNAVVLTAMALLPELIAVIKD